MLKSGNFRLCVSLWARVRGPLSYEFQILISQVAHKVRNQTYPSHMLSVCMLNKLFFQCNRTKSCVGFIWFICVHIDNQQTKMKMAYYVVYVRVYVSWKGGFDNMESVLLYWNYTTYFSNFRMSLFYVNFFVFYNFEER